jgi:protein gp37
MEHKISWLNIPGYIPATLNPVGGCNKCSLGCENCYAEKMAVRLSGMPATKDHYSQVVENGKWNGKTFFNADQLKKLYKWKAPHAIFMVSMGDLFHESVPFWWIDEVFDAMLSNPQHLYIILTKRPDRAGEYFKYFGNKIKDVGFDSIPSQSYNPDDHYELPNFIWLGATAENQEQANFRIPILLTIPAKVRFVSVEPMLGRVDLLKYLGGYYETEEFGKSSLPGSVDRGINNRQSGEYMENSSSKMESLGRHNTINSLSTTESGTPFWELHANKGNDQSKKSTCVGASVGLVPFIRSDTGRDDDQSQEWKSTRQPTGKLGIGNLLRTDVSLDTQSWKTSKEELARTILWVICGGESGNNARPMHPDWVRSLRDQCKDANVPFFFKQWGEYCASITDKNVKEKAVVYNGIGYSMQKVGRKAAGNLLDGVEYHQFQNSHGI